MVVILLPHIILYHCIILLKTSVFYYYFKTWLSYEHFESIGHKLLTTAYFVREKRR